MPSLRLGTLPGRFRRVRRGSRTVRSYRFWGTVVLGLCMAVSLLVYGVVRFQRLQAGGSCVEVYRAGNLVGRIEGDDLQEGASLWSLLSRYGAEPLLGETLEAAGNGGAALELDASREALEETYLELLSGGWRLVRPDGSVSSLNQIRIHVGPLDEAP